MTRSKSSKRWSKSVPNGVSQVVSGYKKPIYDLLEETTEKYPTRVALISDYEIELTYEELKKDVDKLAGSWMSMGLEKNEKIGLMLPNTHYYVISYYAAMKLGLIVVQINPYYTSRELLEIVNDSELNYLVVEEVNEEKTQNLESLHHFKCSFLTESSTERKYVIECMIEGASLTSEKPTIDPEEDIAIIQYTSGTTGQMKGVMLTHSNIVANVFQSYAVYGGTMEKGKEVFLTAIPLYHVYSMTSSMNLGIYIGATNVLMNSYHVDGLLEKIKKFRPTYLPAVPRIYNDIVHHPNIRDYNLNCLKFCSCGSAPLPIEVLKKFEEMTDAVIGEGYGLSEASPSTHRNPPLGLRKIGSIGIPLPSTDCKIVCDEGKELPINSVGELIVKGPQVMKGYWKNDLETKSSLKEGWLYTADLAKQDKDGYFYILGRKKEMIITNGFNVYPLEIENVIYEHPEIIDCAVLGVEDVISGERVIAFIVVNESSDVTVSELEGHCYRELAPYKVPEEFKFVESLPRSNVGKVLKTKLTELY